MPSKKVVRLPLSFYENEAATGSPKALVVADGEKPTATRVRRHRTNGVRYERIAIAYGISVGRVKKLELEKGEVIYTGKGTTALGTGGLLARS
jgi:hypothetical protein